jgi:hypothetical protein
LAYCDYDHQSDNAKLLTGAIDSVGARALLELLNDDSCRPYTVSRGPHLRFNAIWASVEEASCQAEAFAQVSRDMVAILLYTANFPGTDKGSTIRAQVYQQYAELIEILYPTEARRNGGLQLGLAETQSHLLQLCWDELRISI